LGRAIREVEGTPSAARLELLRVRIAASTIALLDSKRDRPLLEWMTRWARTEVALVAAATVLAAVLGSATVIGRADVAADTTVATATSITRQVSPAAGLDSVVTRAVATGASSEQVMNALVGPANGEWLLIAAVVR
jgi:hypothetical protein